jgi:hypothetical protein
VKAVPLSFRHIVVVSPVCCSSAAFPWASCLAVAAALGTNLIEFIAGQVLYSQMLKAANAAAATGHICAREHSVQVRASLYSDPRV